MGPGSDVPATWGAQLAHAERNLAVRAGVTAREEALILLGSLLGEPMAYVLAQPATPMNPGETERYAAWVARRVAGEAVAHITGHLAFMGMDLTVGSDTPLVSPAARRLVEVALECARNHTPGELSAAEIGTGCGAVALALATFEPHFARIFAVDPSPNALRAAAANGVHYLLNLIIDWREGDGLDAVPERVDMIICDSPAPALSPRVTRLFAEAPAKLRSGGVLLCALDSAVKAKALESLTRALPDARIWTAPSSGDSFVVVAQLPRSPADRAGGTASKTERQVL